MILFKLAIKSLRNRKFSVFLTVASIALSLALLLSVERAKRASEEGFTQSISQVDLLVGARTGPINLILYTVFNMGSASNNISWKTYQEIKSNELVEWTIPYSLGDGHQGFRVVATDENFYKYYRFRGQQSIEFLSGKPALDIWDVVIGSEVQKKLKYNLGDQVIVAHGVTRDKAVQLHDDKPFKVTGILKPTGTSVDQSLYISLFGIEAIHLDWKSGSAPTESESLDPKTIKKEDLQIGQITSFFVRTKNRIKTLTLQREINEYEQEPLMAIIPGATLSQLWQGLSQIDVVLKIISYMVMAVGLASMLSSILAGLNERRREMSILRSIGASPIQIMLLLVFESTFLTFCGVVLGVLIQLSSFFLLSGWLADQFGFYVTGSVMTQTELIYMAITLFAGALIGVIPAYIASRSALKDGLSVRI